MTKRPTLTIDGPAASGKGSVAKIIADDFNLYYIETGIFYRLVAYHFLLSNISMNNLKTFLFSSCNSLNKITIEKKKLYKADVTKFASILAKEKVVRDYVLNQQKAIINDYPSEFSGIILEGRDCGTVIAPNANLKIFMSASLEVRAKRRVLQLEGNRQKTNYEKVFDELKRRDQRDIQRNFSPLKKAESAFEIDSTNLNLGDTINIVKKLIFSKLPYLKMKKNNN